MTGKWISLTEACQSLGVSESTLRRRINDGKVEAKLEDGRRLVLVDIDSQSIQIELKFLGSLPKPLWFQGLGSIGPHINTANVVFKPVYARSGLSDRSFNCAAQGVYC